MSPAHAIQSDVFRTYVLIIAAVLAAGGAVIAAARWRFGHDKFRGVWLTYRSWLVMAPLAVAVALLGSHAVVLGWLLLAAFGYREYARACGIDRHRSSVATAYALLGLTAVTASLVVYAPYRHWPRELFAALPALAAAAFVCLPVLRNRAKGEFHAAALGLLGFVYVGWMFGHLALLPAARHPYGCLMFLVFACEVSDVAAFTFGKLFGRRKLCPQISPNKTWAGALGGLGVAMALPWALRFSFPHFSNLHLLLAGLIVGVGGQLGDLSVSLMKRDLGIKDMGTAIPGHGGVLDRIDSLLLAAPLFLYLVRSADGR